MIVLSLTSWEAILALFGTFLVVVAWAYRLTHGFVVRPVWLGVLSAVYLLLFFALETGHPLAVGAVAPIDLLDMVVALGLTAWYVADSTRVVRGAPGKLSLRSSAGVPIAWWVLLLAEIYVPATLVGYVTILGTVTVSGFPTPFAVPAGATADPYATTIAVVDALFALGTGLTIGLNVGIAAAAARSYRTLRKTPPAGARRWRRVPADQGSG